MSPSPLTVSLLLIVALGFLHSSSAQTAVFPATEKEKDICIESGLAKGLVFEDAKKVRRMDCEVICMYEGDKSTEYSPEGQPCCPAGGVATGNCGKEGDCIPYIFG